MDFNQIKLSDRLMELGLTYGISFLGALSNVASGVMLLLFRPFKIGDYVEIGGIGRKFS